MAEVLGQPDDWDELLDEGIDGSSEASVDRWANHGLNDGLDDRPLWQVALEDGDGSDDVEDGEDAPSDRADDVDGEDAPSDRADDVDTYTGRCAA